MEIEKLKQEYRTQDNRSTAYPIFVTVQELFCVGVIADGYTAHCPYGDGYTRTEYRINGDGEPDMCETREQAIDLLKERYEGCSGGGLEAAIEEIEEFNMGYIWVDREWFLTIKSAEKYMKTNAHNHEKLRTYVHSFHRSNFEMCVLLKTLEFNEPKDS